MTAGFTLTVFATVFLGASLLGTGTAAGLMLVFAATGFTAATFGAGFAAAGLVGLVLMPSAAACIGEIFDMI